MSARVTELWELDRGALERLSARYGLTLAWIEPGAAIPASYWGEPEAGLCADALYVRADTPLNSALHELAHYVCMSPARRAALYRDAGGDDLEECAVCYLQVLLGETLGCPRGALLGDMDRWGYSFREGSAARWFAGDGVEARAWLAAHGLVSEQGLPTWRIRGAVAVY